MNGLFLLYSLSFLPIEAGRYTAAASATREAVFISTGIKGDWERVKGGAESALPPVVRHGLAAAGVVHRRELLLHDPKLGTLRLSPSGASAVYTLRW